MVLWHINDFSGANDVWCSIRIIIESIDFNYFCSVGLKCKVVDVHRGFI